MRKLGQRAPAGIRPAQRSPEAAAAAGVDVASLLPPFRERADDSRRFVDAYRRYCWPIQSIDDVKLAPFHLLATEGAVHSDKTHLWHMEALTELCSTDGLLHPTAYTTVDTTDSASVEAGCAWWSELTERGGEGMVVKPHSFIARNSKGFAQPAVKVRGREYLRIIYGPEYTAPDQIERLRSRGLGRKRGMAAREFALGVEALQRFVRKEPLRRVHECVFGVLALESEPVDPRL